MKQSKQLTLRQLKAEVYKQYQVENSQQLKKTSTLAAKLDLRYKKSWHLLKSQGDKSMDNVVSLANHIASQENAVDILDTGLRSLGEDLSAFEQKIELDFAEKRENSQKYRESLTYL